MQITNEVIETACEVLNDAYEASAGPSRWTTQAPSIRLWKDLPEREKPALRTAVRALLIHLSVEDEKQTSKLYGGRTYYMLFHNFKDDKPDPVKIDCQSEEFASMLAELFWGRIVFYVDED